MTLHSIEYYSLNECLRVQMDGKKVCKECPLFETDACGGKELLASGRNQKGFIVGEEGLTLSKHNNPEAKNKKKKKK
mgnify:CR=1 FL=1